MTLPPDWDDFEAKLTVELIAIAKCSNAQARPFATQAAFLRAFLFAIDPVLDVRDAAARERADRPDVRRAAVEAFVIVLRLVEVIPMRLKFPELRAQIAPTTES